MEKEATLIKRKLEKLVILDKINFRKKSITRDKDGHFLIKGKIHQRDRTILNIYIPNNRALKCFISKLIELKGEMEKSIIIVRLQHFSLGNS